MKLYLANPIEQWDADHCAVAFAESAEEAYAIFDAYFENQPREYELTEREITSGDLFHVSGADWTTIRVVEPRLPVLDQQSPNS